MWTVEVLRSVVADDSEGVDIGDNRGAILKEMLAAAPRGHHFAFEPIPELAAELRDEFPSAQVMEMALSDTHGIRPFRHVLGLDGYSGFVQRPFDTYEENVEMIDVQVRRLDDVLPESYTPRFIKIDVEGSEAEVFRGGFETLCRARPYVAFEWSWESEDAWDLLVEGAGLCLNRLDRWLTGRRPFTRAEFLDDLTDPSSYFFLAHPRRRE